MTGSRARASRATLPSIARFLTWPEDVAARTLARLRSRGDVACQAANAIEYKLTEIGRREAARRFAEEFTPLLAQGHGECNDPDCECRTLGPGECRGRPIDG